MSRWRAFVDVLDEILNDREPSPTAVDAARRSTRIASTPLYAAMPNRTPNRFWSAPPAPRTSQPRSALDSFKHLGHSSAPAAGERLDTRPARLLEPAEETALQTLIRLGAALDRSFTTRELRSTFRTLAQRYHPDRHPGASETERQRLGATFAELAAAYGTLLEPSSK